MSDTSKTLFFSPPISISLNGSVRTCSVSREKHSLPHHTPFGFPEALTASHHLMPGEERSLQKSSHKHQRYTVALPPCSPDHSIISQLGKWAGSAYFPDWPGVLLTSETAPDLLTAPHTRSHFISCWMIDWHTVLPFFIQWESFTKAAFQGYYCVSIGTKWEEKTKPLRYFSNTTCTCICMESSAVALFCSASINCNILCSSCCFDTIVSVSLLCKLWISLSLATSLFCTSVAEMSGF